MATDAGVTADASTTIAAMPSTSSPNPIFPLRDVPAAPTPSPSTIPTDQLPTSSSTTSSHRPKRPLFSRSPPTCFTDTHGILLLTTNEPPTPLRTTRVLGTVYGLTVRSRNWGADLGASLKAAVGGEMRPFTKMMYGARDEATERLMEEVLKRGGNAVLAMRYDVNDLNGGCAVCAYGTAVVLVDGGAAA